ncbi:MAG: hypothetical protein ABI237_12145 [Ginsengibacter sp.]
MLACDFESLKSHWVGYSDFGVYQECLEGIREQMADFPDMILSGQLSLPAIAKVVECFCLMESLARYPNATNNEESFKNDPWWQKVRSLAKEAAQALE